MEISYDVRTADLVNVLNQLKKEVKELSKETTDSLLHHDRKIADLCNYIKGNLSNELRVMLDAMNRNGELDKIINETIINEISDLYDRVGSLDTEVNKLKTKTKKYVFVGDSYAEGYNPYGNVKGYPLFFKEMMGLNESNFINLYRGGAGFGLSNSYTNLIRNVSVDYDVTDVVVAGSYNDHSCSEEQITNGIIDFKNKAKEKYPNAKVHVAFIGKSTSGAIIERLAVIYKYYKDACDNNDIDFLEGTHCALQDTFSFLCGDGTHPTEDGQREIARCIKIALEKGFVNLYKSYPLMFAQLSGGSEGIHWETILQNGVVHLMSKYAGEFIFDSNNKPVLEGKQYCKLADITTGYIVGSNSCHAVATGVPCVVQIEDDTYHEISLNFIIRNKELLIQSNLVSDAHDNYKTYKLKKLQVGEFSTSVPALYC